MRIKLENYSKALSRGQTHMRAKQTAAIIIQSQPPRNEKEKRKNLTGNGIYTLVEIQCIRLLLA